MSVSSLPEWKQLLLERKRKEEEERERREREEEERLASMPAWKRGIIQRRRAKQEGEGERDREREQDARAQAAASRAAAESTGEARCGCDRSREPPTVAGRPAAEPELQGQVSTETIRPVRQNPFIRSQSGWRRAKEGETTREGALERGRGRGGERGNDDRAERDRERDGEAKAERDVDRREGKGTERERDTATQKNEKERDSSLSLFPLPLVPCLRTIRAENIIIIEQDRPCGEREERSRWDKGREGEEQEKQEEKPGMRMDLRELLAGGGSVTEIRASEVLIIKPSASTDDRTAVGRGPCREGEGARGSETLAGREGWREKRADWGREERERDWGRKEGGAWPKLQKARETELESDGKGAALDERGAAESGGRVSQLLSKFGEHPKPPSRSKSTDCFVRPAKCREGPGLGGEEETESQKERGEEGRGAALRGVPKRSFSFSDRVICGRENGAQEERGVEQRDSSGREVMTFNRDALEGEEKGHGGHAHITEDEEVKNYRGRGREGEMDVEGKPHSKEGVVRGMQTVTAQGVGKGRERVEMGGERVERGGERLERGGERLERGEDRVDWGRERVGKDGDRLERGRDRVREPLKEKEREEGFTVASVRNVERIGFARRVPVRQEGKERDRMKGREVGRGSGPGTEGETAVRQKEREGEDKPTSVKLIQPYSSESSNPEGRDKPPLLRDRESPALPTDSTARNSSNSADCVTWHCPGRRSRDQPAGVGPSGVGVQGHPTSLPCQGTEEAVGGREEREGAGASCSGAHTDTAVKSDGESDSGAETRRPPEKGEREREVHSHGHTNTARDSEDHPTTPRLFPIKPGCPKMEYEIQIPRTPFYGVEVAPEGRVGRGEGGKGVERRESWKAGRPLTRIESLREKIRQREMMEKERKKEGEGEEDSAGEEKRKEGSVEREEKEREVLEKSRKEGEGEVKQREKEEGGEERERVEGGEEGPLSKGSSHLSITQEAGALKPGPQLPVSLSRSLSGADEEEAVSAPSSACPRSLSSEGEEDEGQIADPEHPGPDRCPQENQDTDGGGEEGRDNEKESPGKDCESRYLPPSLSPSPTASLSPSPPLLPSLIDMSRIYNLTATAAPRTAASFGGRKTTARTHCPAAQQQEAPPRDSQTETEREPCHPEPQPQSSRKVGLKHGLPQEPGTAEGRHTLEERPTVEATGMRAVLQQVEQLRLREEAGKRAPQSARTPRLCTAKTGSRDRPAEPKEPRVAQRQQKEEAQPNTKPAAREQQTPHTEKTPDPPQQPHGHKTPAKHTPSNQSHPPRSFTVNPKSGPPPENAPKNPERGSSVAPAPSLSAPLFSLRSTAAGQTKRGNTITITPRRTPGGAGAGPASGVSKAAPPAQTPTPNGMGEGTKKRYPTAEEIEVIGGYQQLERSCLVKHRGTPKRVKVCFDDVHLEQVCEYPSESSLLASLPCPAQSDPDREREEKGVEEEEEDEEEERGMFMSRSGRIAGSESGRMLKVDESCRR